MTSTSTSTSKSKFTLTPAAKRSLQLALEYTSKHPDRYIFPIKVGAKFPPLIRDDLAAASNDPKVLAGWVKQFGQVNWGLSLKKSRIFLVDTDVKEGKFGAETHDMLDLRYGFPETETVRTPSGGTHEYYSGEHVFALGKNGLGPDVDAPNYALIAGSTLKDGTSYQLTKDLPSASAPQWFYDVIKSAKKGRVSNSREEVVETDDPDFVAWAVDYLLNGAEEAISGKGGEFVTLKVAMSLRDNGISEEMANTLMNQYYNVEIALGGKCDPEWDPEELRVKIGNAYRYASQSAVGGKTAAAEFTDIEADVESIAMISATVAPETAAEIETEVKARKTKKEANAGKLTKVELSKKFVWVGGVGRFIMTDDTDEWWKADQVDTTNGHLCTKKVRSIAKHLVAEGQMKSFDKIVYLPNEGIELGRSYNLYRPSGVVPQNGDLTWWEDHLSYLFPDQADRDHVLNWMAWFLQNLSLKPKHALLIQGHVQGTGKTFIAKMLEAILGEDNVSIVAEDDLNNSFNGYAVQCKLILIEELRAGGERGRIAAKLHHLITEERTRINRKNVEQKDIANCFGIFAMSNHDAAVSLDNTDRRYLIIRTDADVRFGRNTPKSQQYYTELYARTKNPASVAAVAHSLLNRDLKGYDGRGPAPHTAAKGEMIKAGHTDLEVWLIDNADTYPLNARVVSVQDVIDAVPSEIARRITGGRINSHVTSILKRSFGAVELGKTRLGGRSDPQPRLWSLRGSVPKGRAPKEIAAIYLADKAAEKSVADAAPVLDDFDADDGGPDVFPDVVLTIKPLPDD